MPTVNHNCFPETMRAFRSLLNSIRPETHELITQHGMWSDLFPWLTSHSKNSKIISHRISRHTIWYRRLSTMCDWNISFNIDEAFLYM